MTKILTSATGGFIIRFILLVIMIPLIFIALFFLGNVFAGDINIELDLYIENSDDVKLTYKVKGTEKEVYAKTVSSDIGDKKVLVFKVSGNNDGIYKISFGENTERIRLERIKLSGFFNERTVEAMELSAFFTEKEKIGNMLYSGGFFILEKPASGAAINNIDPIKPLPAKLFNIILLGLVSFILAIILSSFLKRFLYGFLLGKINPDFKIGTTQFISGTATALLIVFSISILAVGGSPELTFDNKGIIKKPPEKIIQVLNDLPQEEDIDAEQPPETELEYVPEPFPLRTDISEPGARENTPQCRLEDLFEGNFPLEDPSMSFVVGKTDKDGNMWTFFAGNENDNTVTDYTGETSFNENQLRRISTIFINQAKWCEEQGIKFYITIPPNKNSIYPEYMPDSIKRGTTKRMDQLIDYLRENTDLVVIDVRDELMQAKIDYPDEYLFYNFDTHWNNHGGFVASKKIVETIKKDFPAIPVLNKSDYQIDYFPAYMKDMTWYMGWYDYFDAEGPVYTKKTKETAVLEYIDGIIDGGIWHYVYTHPDGYNDSHSYCKFINDAIPDAPKLYMIRDSFCIAMFQFLKESFSESTFRWSTDFHKDRVLEADPDVVIFEMVERKLGELLRKNIFKD